MQVCGRWSREEDRAFNVMHDIPAQTDVAALHGLRVRDFLSRSSLRI